MQKIKRDNATVGPASTTDASGVVIRNSLHTLPLIHESKDQEVLRVVCHLFAVQTRVTVMDIDSGPCIDK